MNSTLLHCLFEFRFYEKRYQCTKKRHLNPMDLHMNLVNEE